MRDKECGVDSTIDVLIDHNKVIRELEGKADNELKFIRSICNLIICDRGEIEKSKIRDVVLKKD